MDAMKLSNEIEDLLKEKKIDTDAAIRLMLVSQKEILERLASVENGVKKNGAATEEHAQFHVKYPSLTWLWYHRRKELIIAAVVLFIIFYTLFSPITISDLRHPIMDYLGLPHD